jgi:hypothetical protein
MVRCLVIYTESVLFNVTFFGNCWEQLVHFMLTCQSDYYGMNIYDTFYVRAVNKKARKTIFFIIYC